MRNLSFLGRVAACAGALGAATMTIAGCGGGGSVCDVDFGTLAGAYSFTFKTHDVRYSNSCFDNFDEPQQTDPAKLTNCTWVPSSEEESITIELVIEETGDIGSAHITSIKGDDVDQDFLSVGVKCEMLEGALCDAPIRCSLTGDTCSSPTVSNPDDWEFACNCMAGSMNDPASAACQECKTSYAKYEGERTENCQKGRDGDYFEFTLHVKE